MFATLGVFVAVYGLIVVGSLVYEWLLRPSAMPRFLRGDQEAWALVTGASDGIGLGFCQELAARGFHLILHGRSRQKLEQKAADLSKQFPRLKTQIFVADASSFKSDDFKALGQVIKDIRLTVLVNNVGGAANLPTPFMNLQDQSLENIQGLLNLNAGFTSVVTSIVLPVLMQNEPSLILNIGSIGAMGAPRVSVYSGTKGYLASWSEALQTELVMQGRDVKIHCVIVGNVQSGGYGIEHANLMVPTPKRMARAALDKAGAWSVAITPYLPHAISAYIMGRLPSRVRGQAFIVGIKKAEEALSKSK